MRETVEIVQMACRGEKLAYPGKIMQLPRPGKQGKALRLAQPPTDVPIYLATLAPRGLELTGEIADGWLGTSFTPDAAEAHLAHLRRGAEKAGRKLEDIALCVDAAVAITDDPEPFIQAHKASLAFQLSAMGSPTLNFYNDAYARSGFQNPCREVRDRWLAGDRAGAVQAVPDAMVRETTLFGDCSWVRERIEQYRAVGIDELMLHPVGSDMSKRLDVLGQSVELVQQASASAS